MGGKETTAEEMAKAAGVGAKQFRQRLRDAQLPWHVLGTHWTVVEGSDEHGDMQAVLARMVKAS
ncbi:hypothetical protein G5B46_16700 [Caulobacter sp. 602-2]|uniref:Uncharacterized protein n=1 Tax=Caulobacter sp. 602-2 TaxID=2710887 RepID=A0A6G4R047_9CAUL|nr:hypothetical protein [Caulobacter sp. 602-2]NGM51250.1 hypothetical protein [Caulobacter sp. 602-2]